MRKNFRCFLKKCISVTMVLAMTLSMVCYFADQGMTAQATTVTEVQKNIDKINQEINKLNQNVENWEEKQEILAEEMEDLNAEIINTMTSIGMKEDEIAETEQALVYKEADIEDTAAEYERAKETETKQYDDMIVRLRKMYENGGEQSSLNMLLSGNGMADILNQMDFVESVYSYDRQKLTEFTETKELVLELWNQLEAEKLNLEAEKRQLELDKLALEGQKSDLNNLLSKKKAQSANYDAEIKKAKQEASVAKKKLQQEQQTLKRLQEEAKKKNTTVTTNAANGTYTTNYNSVIDNAGGSDLGKQIAKYACQYVGNPYVPGGTSLTSGADCSGFTYRVYSDFGYKLPRTSTEQRSAGRGVSYSEAQPGDLICYSGHVALYIGGGMIVHASTQKTGIKIGNAQYREILAVRRII
ncbi:MAG: C40 family peptidase [Lachnospiraceae bacterium]|nr:C40 family peptidase [Lachnospiraceae bacterium]